MSDIEISVKGVVDTIGRPRLVGDLGLKNAKAISTAVANGLFPSSWYDVIDKICRNELNFDVPRKLFNWKSSKSEEVA